MPDFNLHRPPTREIQLLDLSKRLAQKRMGRTVVHIHLSSLATAYQRPAYIRIATDTFSNLASGFEGQLFTLENNDLVFIARHATATVLEAVVERLRVLFIEDPAIHDNKAPEARFVTWYDLEQDAAYDLFVQAAQDLLQEAESRRINPQSPPTLSPMGPSLLTRIDQILGNLDVSPLTRRQTVCSIIDQTPPQPLFEELYVSIDDLQHAIAPEVELTNDPWLFRYLTKTLDKRVMSMLVRDGVKMARPFSINLNVATILTPEFMKFEAVVTPQLRGRLVIEMNKLDVFSDMGAFFFARDYLHDHGFRVCLDGLTHHTLPYYDRAKLGFDLIKIHWTPNSLDSMMTDITPTLRTIVRETGQAHTILCRCEDKHAIEVGQNLGIVMFQGRQVDRLLRGF